MNSTGDQLVPEQRAYLLRLARDSAGAALGGPALQAEAPGDEILRAPRACFVTFKRRGSGPGCGLRGCLGTLEARDPLWLAVKRLAADTVTRDPRFRDHPVTLDELPELEVDISVLHPRRDLADPLNLELGHDGIVVEGQGSYKGCHGVYLPQVAGDHGMSKEEFLSSCCSHKARLPADAWRDPAQCKVYAFRAEVFSEV
jgi:AmmeMemoRadiSam system protein A